IHTSLCRTTRKSLYINAVISRCKIGQVCDDWILTCRNKIAGRPKPAIGVNDITRRGRRIGKQKQCVASAEIQKRRLRLYSFYSDKSSAGILVAENVSDYQSHIDRLVY